MTKFKINLIEAPDEMSCNCPFGRAMETYEPYNFDHKLDLLIKRLNLIKNIDCKKDNNTSIVIESEISTTGELRIKAELLERIKPEFTRCFCYINYDIKNPIAIIYD